MKLELKTRGKDDRRALCARLKRDRDRDNDIVNNLSPRESQLKADITNLKYDLLSKQDELQRARNLAIAADAASVITKPAGPVSTAATVASIAAGRQVDLLERTVQKLQDMVSNMAREYRVVSDKVAQHRRLLAAADAAIANNSC